MDNEHISDEGKRLRAEYLRKWRERMTEEQKQRRNEYARKYYESHKEYFRKKNAEYWDRKAKTANRKAVEGKEQHDNRSMIVSTKQGMFRKMLDDNGLIIHRNTYGRD